MFNVIGQKAADSLVIKFTFYYLGFTT